MQTASPIDCDIALAVIEAHSTVDRTASRNLAVVVDAVKDRAIVADVEHLQLRHIPAGVVGRNCAQKVDIVVAVKRSHLFDRRTVRSLWRRWQVGRRGRERATERKERKEKERKRARDGRSEDFVVAR